MNDLLGLFYFMVTVFVTYVSIITLLYGVLPSISDSYYALPKKYNLLFTLFCWSFALPAIIIGVELTDNFLMFFAGGAICFVGAAAQFKQTLTKEVHTYSALIGIVSSQLSIAFDFHLYYINTFFILFALLAYYFKPKNYIFWIEIVAFTSICYVLGIELYKYLGALAQFG